MYDDIIHDWYLRENPKRRTVVFHGRSNTGKTCTINRLKQVMHTFDYKEVKGSFNRKYFDTEYQYQLVTMDEGCKKMLFGRGTEGIAKHFFEGRGMPWEEKY